MAAFAAIPDDEKALLIWKGMALEVIQGAEATLGTVLQFVFHPRRMITIESLDAEEGTLGRRTLGQLISELARRADVQPDLEKLLATFLEQRNRFVHHSKKIQKDGGREAVILLARTPIVTGYQTSRALGAIIVFWMRQLESQPQSPVVAWEEILPPELDDISDLVPQVPFIIRPKKGSR